MRKKELVRHFSRFGVASPPPPTSSLARARLDVLSEKGNSISPENKWVSCCAIPYAKIFDVVYVASLAQGNIEGEGGNVIAIYAFWELYFVATHTQSCIEQAACDRRERRKSTLGG